MNICKENYEQYQFDNECINIFPLGFIEKYGVMPYCFIDEALLLLVNDHFSFYTLNRINYFIKYKIIVSYIKDSEWDELIKFFKISTTKNKAISKYEVSSDITKNDLIMESNEDFYHAEIENSPIVKIVNSIIEEAITLKSSDIHISPMEKEIKVRFRIDGKLLDKDLLPIISLDEISTRIKVLANLDITKKFMPQDGKIKFKSKNGEYDLRVSILPSIYGERIVLRLLNMESKFLEIKDLGLTKEASDNIYKLTTASSGLILVTGPTGSGKSTSLQAFLYKNLERNENIITVEDPVEYTIDGITQVQINEEAGLDFSTCLRSILRQDPNIIMIGEIRDIETAKIACRASITGHLVYSTLHTNSSVGVISRLKDMNIEKFLLADSLKGIISQRLVRCLCPNCKRKEQVTSVEASYLGVSSDTEIFKPVGCGRCNFTGYKGRRGIYEVIIIDDDFKKLIDEDASPSKYWRLIKKKGFQTLFENGKKLVLDGDTSIEEIQSVLN